MRGSRAEKVARHFLFYREPPAGTGIHQGVSRTSPPGLTNHAGRS